MWLKRVRHSKVFLLEMKYLPKDEVEERLASLIVDHFIYILIGEKPSIINEYAI